MKTNSENSTIDTIIQRVKEYQFLRIKIGDDDQIDRFEMIYQNTRAIEELKEIVLSVYLSWNPDTLERVQRLLLMAKIGFEEAYNYGLKLTDDETGRTCQVTIKQMELLRKDKVFELDKLINTLSWLTNSPSQIKQTFKFTEKKGARLDLLKLLEVIHAKNWFHNHDGSLPGIEQFIEAFEQFSGADLKNHATSLSQAKLTQSTTYLKIFHDLLNKATEKLESSN